MVRIVLVAHSRDLAFAVKRLVEHVTRGVITVSAAGGIDDPANPYGTDATAIRDAIDAVFGAEGVAVLMDVGSSILSAEFALELLPGEMREKVRLCGAPLVEGAIAAGVSAAGGGTLEEVVREARGSIAPKSAHLGEDAAAPSTAASASTPEGAGLPAGPRDAPGGSGGVSTRGVVLKVRAPLGLHLRPAAQLVRTASLFDAAITVRNLTGNSEPVSAKSINLVATLDVRSGHEIAVTATGKDAEDALNALKALVEGNFGEPEKTQEAEPRTGCEPAPAPGALAPGAPAGAAFAGEAASPGVAVGPVLLYRLPPSIAAEIHVRGPEGGGPSVRPSVLPSAGPAAKPSVEWGRLERTLESVAVGLEAERSRMAARAGEYQSSIYDAHALILRDPALREKARALVFDRRMNAEAAWDEAVGWAAGLFDSVKSEGLRLRRSDIAELRERVRAALAGVAVSRFEIPEPSILVAIDVGPSEMARLEVDKVLGICTAAGGKNTHGAILARSIGIPMVVGLGSAVLALAEGSVVAIDGSSGCVWTDPGDVVGKRELHARRLEERGREAAVGRGPAVTSDGMRVEVSANVNTSLEAGAAVERGAEGIGVLRTELLFARRASAPSEEEQVEAYSSIVRIMGPRPVVIRTLDAGGDKAVPYIGVPSEGNPFLGVRGIRLSLRNTELFETQLRAILRVSAGRNVKILIPMVSTVSEVREARDCLLRAADRLRSEGFPFDEGIEMGIMVEVPSAALLAERLAPEAGFLSIGTNDLCQYAMAADRSNAAVAELNDALHPAVLRLVRSVVEAGRGAGKRVSVCGEIGADPVAVPVLVGLGVESLSVGPAAIPAVKRAVRLLDSRECAKLAREALTLESAAGVRELVVKSIPSLAARAERGTTDSRPSRGKTRR